MMSACSMLSENTGHGVRATHRTNALIRRGSVAAVVTQPTVSVSGDSPETKKSRRHVARRAESCRKITELSRNGC